MQPVGRYLPLSTLRLPERMWLPIVFPINRSKPARLARIDPNPDYMPGRLGRLRNSIRRDGALRRHSNRFLTRQLC